MKIENIPSVQKELAELQYDKNQQRDKFQELVKAHVSQELSKAIAQIIYDRQNTNKN